MTAAGNLFAQQEANRKASRRLVAGFILFVAWLGFGGDLIWYLASRNSGDPGGYGLHVFPGIGLLLTLIAVATAWSGYRFGATMLIKATGARELVTPSTEPEQRLVNIVEEMSIAAGARKPRVWIVPDDAPNAFATGVKPEEAHIAVTEGALETLNRQELQGVVAHEMGHIVNYDVKLMTLLTALVGMVAIIHNSAFRVMRFGGGGRRRSRSSKDGGAGILVIVLLVLWIISWVIAPIVTRLMVMKVGRSREYLADAMSAQFTRNPGALADALVKIEGSTAKPDAIPKSSAQLCISDPFHSKWDDREGRFANLMATHPPIRERVRRLREMAYQNSGTVDSLNKPLSMSEA
ncbi:MAG TPA: M48 family metallopeptidase [Gemmatimonadaceae bacterium]|nr:M48 family metallopeptidase [Gemmatimonadaceae bacterium]